MSQGSEVSVRVSQLLPSELRFTTPAKAIPGSALKLKVPADRNSCSSKTNSVFKFYMPNSASLWSARNTRICFNAQMQGTYATVAPAADAGSGWAYNKYVHNFFSKLRILVGTKEIVSIEDYGTLCSILMECNSNDDYNDSIGDIMSNTGNFYERAQYIKHADTIGTQTQFAKRRFCMSLIGTNILDNTLPLFINAPWVIELTVAPIASFLEYGVLTAADAAAGKPAVAGSGGKPATQLALFTDIVLDNITLHTKVLTLSTEYERQLREEFANNVKTIAFTSYEQYAQQSNGNLHSIIIPVKKSVVSGLLCVQRDESNSVDPQYLDKKHGKFLYNGLTQYSMVINGVHQPSEPVMCTEGGAEMMQELLEFFNKQSFTVGSMCIKDNNWTVLDGSEGPARQQSTIVSMDMRKFHTSLISGENTAQSTGSLLFKALTDQQLSTSTDNTFVFFIRHESLVQFINGRVDVVN